GRRGTRPVVAYLPGAWQTRAALNRENAKAAKYTKRKERNRRKRCLGGPRILVFRCGTGATHSRSASHLTKLVVSSRGPVSTCIGAGSFRAFCCFRVFAL